MLLKKINIDSLGFEDDAAPNYGSVTVEIGGRSSSFRLDQGQVDRLVKLGAEIATEIHAEIAAMEPAAA